MARFSGLGNLEHPEDLLAKLHHDYERVRNTPGDSYAAFDFFVTAEHMIDWVLPGQPNRQAREKLRASSVLLQVVSHVASGAKHFIAESRHHQFVQHVDDVPATFQENAFQEDAFQTGRLSLTLEGTAAESLGEHLDVRDLAARIRDFWDQHLRQDKSGPSLRCDTDPPSQAVFFHPCGAQAPESSQQRLDQGAPLPASIQAESIVSRGEKPPRGQPHQGLTMVRDVAIVLGSGFLGGFLIGLTGASGPRREFAQAVPILLLGTAGFAIVGCLTPTGRFRRLLVVALLSWCASLVQVLFGQPFSEWFFGLIGVLIMMGIGGGLSFLFVRGSAPDVRVTDRSPAV